MMPAAHVLEGESDVLMLGRKKGPAEILLPMLPWRLTEATDEASARLPFAVAGLGTLATLFLLGRKLGGDQAGLAAAGVAALNGLLIAFSRIVQYQALLMWMIALAMLCAWEWYERGQMRWALLAGVFTGIGLLAHYDALAVAPVLAYIALLSFLRTRTSGRRREWWRDVLFGTLCMMLVIVPFYGSYLLTSQVGPTGTYLSERIGEGLLKNTDRQLPGLHDLLYFFPLPRLDGRPDPRLHGLARPPRPGAAEVRGSPDLGARADGGRSRCRDGVACRAHHRHVRSCAARLAADLSRGDSASAALSCDPGRPDLAGSNLRGVQFSAGRPQDAYLRHLPAVESARGRRVGRTLECLEAGKAALGSALRWRVVLSCACARS